MLRRLLQDTAVYTVSTVLTAGVNVLLLPVYARLLEPAEYGKYDLIVVVGLLAAVTVALEITQGVMINVTGSDDPGDRALTIASGFWILSFCFTLFLTIVAIASPGIAGALFDAPESADLVMLAASLYFATAVVRYWTVVDRSLFKPWRVFTTSLGSAVLAGTCSVAAVVAGHGVKGLILGQLIGQGTAALAATAAHRAALRQTPTWTMVSNLLRFTTPLVLSSASIVAASYVDRIVVREVLGLEELGVYGFAARIAGLMTLLLIGFQSALTPLIYAELEREGIERDVARIFRTFAGIACSLLLLLFASADALVRLLGGAKFADAGDIVRLLSVSVLVQGAQIFFPGLHVARRTWTLAAINFGGVVVNVTGSLLLVERLGLVGAGIAAVLGAVVVALSNYRMSQRYFRVRLVAARR